MSQEPKFIRKKNIQKIRDNKKIISYKKIIDELFFETSTEELTEVYLPRHEKSSILILGGLFILNEEDGWPIFEDFQKFLAHRDALNIIAFVTMDGEQWYQGEYNEEFISFLRTELLAIDTTFLIFPKLNLVMACDDDIDFSILTGERSAVARAADALGGVEYLRNLFENTLKENRAITLRRDKANAFYARHLSKYWLSVN